MQLEQAISLIDFPMLTTAPQQWADLGCGSGLFTYALAGILPFGSTVYAVDKNSAPLKPLTHPENIKVIKQTLDFEHDEMTLPILDGILMANALHFVKDQKALIRKLGALMSASSHFLIVEYDTDRANQWVPFPISFQTLAGVFRDLGYRSVVRLNGTPSLYGSVDMYSALISR